MVIRIGVSRTPLARRGAGMAFAPDRELHRAEVGSSPVW